MSKPDSRHNKFKSKETIFRRNLPKDIFTVVRLDGKAFHTFTKQFKTPYDLEFMKAMDSTAISVINRVLSAAEFAYVQSDEISIFFTDKFSENQDAPFSGKIEKILSTTASAATGGFMSALPTEGDFPIFDSRILILEDLNEIQEYLDWRRLDARKNSISMAVDTLYSEKELKGKSTGDRLRMLEGTPLEILPMDFFWGRFIIKEKFSELVKYTNRKTGEDKTAHAEKSRWITKSATITVRDEVMKNLKNKVISFISNPA